MKRMRQIPLSLGFSLVFAAVATAQTHDPLPSWNEGASKQDGFTRRLRGVSISGEIQYASLGRSSL